MSAPLPDPPSVPTFVRTRGEAFGDAPLLRWASGGSSTGTLLAGRLAGGGS